MENIFKNAYFGKVYKTRDGRKAIYNYHSRVGYHDLIIDGEGLSYHFADHANGIIRLPYPSKIEPNKDYSSPIDIVSEWQEEIDTKRVSIKGFVAVDNGGDKMTWNPSGRRVVFFSKMPVRDMLTDKPYWATHTSSYDKIYLGYECLPNLSWENEPIEVELRIIKNDA